MPNHSIVSGVILSSIIPQMKIPFKGMGGVSTNFPLEKSIPQGNVINSGLWGIISILPWGHKMHQVNVPSFRTRGICMVNTANANTS